MGMKVDFYRKVVVITGATGGIGRALAQRFARARSRLALIDLDEQQLASLSYRLEKMGVEARGYACDITDQNKIREIINVIIHHYGGIDVLINNAGITHRSLFVDTELDVFKQVMEVNYFGALNCTKCALESLIQRRGHIITMSSMAGFAPQFLRSGYSASKYALHGLFESLRTELARDSVKVMIVCPGFTATDMNRNALRGDGGVVASSFSLFGRIASPVEVAESIFKGAQHCKKLLVLSNVGKTARVAARLFPTYFERRIAKLLSVGDNNYYDCNMDSNERFASDSIQPPVDRTPRR